MSATWPALARSPRCAAHYGHATTDPVAVAAAVHVDKFHVPLDPHQMRRATPRKRSSRELTAEPVGWGFAGVPKALRSTPRRGGQIRK